MEFHRAGLSNYQHRQSSFNLNQSKPRQYEVIRNTQPLGKELKTNSTSLASRVRRDRVRDENWRTSLPPSTPASRSAVRQQTPIYRALPYGYGDSRGDDVDVDVDVDDVDEGVEDARSVLPIQRESLAVYSTPRQIKHKYLTPQPTPTSHISPRPTPNTYLTARSNRGGHVNPRQLQRGFQQNQGGGYMNLRTTPSTYHTSSLRRAQRTSNWRLPLSPELSPAINNHTRDLPPLSFETPYPKPRNTNHFDITPFGSSSSLLQSSAKQRYHPIVAVQQCDQISRQDSPLNYYPHSSYIEGESEVTHFSPAAGEKTHSASHKDSEVIFTTPKDQRTSRNQQDHRREDFDELRSRNRTYNPNFSEPLADLQEVSLSGLSDDDYTSRSSSPEPAPVPESIPIKERIISLPKPQPRSVQKRPLSTKPFSNLPPKTVKTSKTSSHKRNLNSPSTISAPTKKIKSSEQTQVPRTPPERKRQLITAARIISRETAGRDIQLFGEIVETTPERTQRLARENESLESSRKAREDKLQRAALKAEAKAIREREQLRKAAEEAERAKREKQLLEEKKRCVREKKRKKALISEQRDLEIKRQLTLQRIETDRLRAEMEALQRESARKEAEEKAKSVQIDMEALGKLTALRELAKRQAAKLSAGKVTDPPKEDKTSMFMPARLSGPRAKNATTMTAHAGFHASRPISGIKDFKKISEEIEAKKKHEKIDALREARDARLMAIAENHASRVARIAKNNEMVNKFKNVNPPQTPAAKPKSTTKGNAKAKSKSYGFQDSDDEDDDMGGLTIEYPSSDPISAERQESQSPSSAGEVPSASTRATSPSSSPPSAKVSKVKNVTSTPAPKRQYTRKGSTEQAQAKLERTQRDDERARERKKQEFIAKAAAGGKDLGEIDLERKVNDFMERREREKKKRVERQANKAARERAFSSNAVKTTVEDLSFPSTGTGRAASISDEVDLDAIATASVIREERMQDSIAQSPNSAARGSKSKKSANVARKNYYQDHIEESEESEEDPDPVPFKPVPEFVPRSAVQQKRMQDSIARGTKFAKSVMAAEMMDNMDDSDSSEESEEDPDDPVPSKPAETITTDVAVATEPEDHMADLDADLEAALNEAFGVEEPEISQLHQEVESIKNLEGQVEPQVQHETESARAAEGQEKHQDQQEAEPSTAIEEPETLQRQQEVECTKAAEGQDRPQVQQNANSTKVIEDQETLGGQQMVKSAKAVQDPPNQTSSDVESDLETDQLEIYQIFETVIKFQVCKPTTLIGNCFTLKQANRRARERMMQHYKEFSGGPHTFSDNHSDRNEPYYATLRAGELCLDFFEVKVVCTVRPNDVLLELDRVVFQKTLPARTYLLRQTITTSSFTINEADNNTVKNITKTTEMVPGFHFTSLSDANFAACEHTIALLLPQTEDVSHHERHNEHIIPAIWDARDEFTKAELPLNFEIDVVEEDIAWMQGVENIDMAVEMFELQGTFL